VRNFPYHDAGGLLYPELDERIVGVETIAVYEHCHRTTVGERASVGAYGRVGDHPRVPSGIWRERGAAHAQGALRFRPALLWRVMRLGRYAADPSFTVAQLVGRVRVFACDPADTLARGAAASSGVPPEVAQALSHLSGTTLEVTSLIRRLLPPLPSSVPVLRFADATPISPPA
jgi:hypothetical protein